jgi:uncharacterized protein (TIGR03118 family)
MLRTPSHRRNIRSRANLRLETLEDRCLLAVGASVLQTNLVSDLPGVAQVTDPNLVNPWGISESSGSPFWISDNNSWLSTLYNTQGTPQSLVVHMPSPPDPASFGTPTGTVFNIDLKDKAFTISDGTNSGPAIFLFATEDGTIIGWNPGVDPTGQFGGPGGASNHGAIAVDNSGNNFTELDPLKQTGAVYKGLAIATDSNGQTLLYAANFRAGTIDVFKTDFTKDTSLPAGAFIDPKIPKGFAPFDIQELGGKLYVTYAKQNDAKHDDAAGPGRGFIDVFNLDGTPGLPGGTERLVSHGNLNSPWGLALAPSSFGPVAGDLLVGNFGDGEIHIYDPTTGKFLGTVKDSDGEAIQIDGLWSLKVGNGGAGGDTNTVYFTAGIDGEQHGLFGSLAPVNPGTPEGLAEEQNVVIALDVLQLDLNTLQADLSSGAPAATIQQDLQTVATDTANLVDVETQFLKDEAKDLHVKGASSTQGAEVLAAINALFAELGKLEAAL